MDSLMTAERRRKEDAADWMNGLPAWARFVWRIGIPGAIALFLVWQGASQLPQLVRQYEALRAQVAQIADVQSQHQRDSEATFRMLQRICSNTAKTDEERNRCFDK
jgi:hypothetical protein